MSNQDNRQYVRQSDVAIQVISENITALKSDFSDMRSDLREVMKEFSDSVAKLVVLEEKSIHTNLNIERILKIAERSHERIDKLQNDIQKDFEELEHRLDELEKQTPMQQQVNSWVIKALWGAAGLAAMFVMKTFGLL